MQYWLLKSEPDVYSYDELVKDGETIWDGVRNHQAANNMKAMKVGDKAFYYHSNIGREVVAVVNISKLAAQDPTDETGRWVAVSVKPEKKLARPVTLTEIKQNPFFEDFALVRQSRLSVVPVEKKYWDEILKMAEG